VRRDPIVILAYEASWPAAFKAEQARVQPVLAAWLTRSIEHIGSTAVPGLAAKPIIDMVAVVRDIDEASQATGALRDLGWVHAPEPNDPTGRRLSYCTPTIALRTHHLHVVEEQSPAWQGWLAFRDYLQTHPAAAEEYSELKRQLADRYGADPNERDEYRTGKADFVAALTARALANKAP
jgi:GrpB-like predicted nucleotidyltransferase (UPF0157 family)